MKKLYILTESERIHSVLPAHTEEEVSIITESLIKDACIEPLIVCKGVLIDGYLRYHICHEHGIPFEVVEMDFADETAAILWMIKQHIGRRNLSIFQKCEMMLPFREALAADAQQRMVVGKKLNSTANRGRTDQFLADMAGVSCETIRMVRYIIEHGDRETLRRVRKVRSLVKRVVGLTGTPSSNGLMDLWAEYRLIDLGERLGRFITRYRQEFFRPEKSNGQVVFSYAPLPGAEERIYQRISDISRSPTP